MIRTPGPVYSSLCSASFCNVFHYVVGRGPFDCGFPTNDNKEFIKSCENLELLVLGDLPEDEDMIAIFSCAIEHYEHLSELYLGNEHLQVRKNLSRWKKILIPTEFAYDPVGDIILDYQTLYPVKFERLRQYTEDDWKFRTESGDDNDDDDDDNMTMVTRLMNDDGDMT